MAALQLGVIGLGTMGANLARNAARNGAMVAVYNRTTEKMDAFMRDHGSDGNFVVCRTVEELCKALQPPRPILLMVKAGDAVDAVIGELLSHLSGGDILIDGGNSHYPDTERRAEVLKERGIHFIGMGVSGGEEGALSGPSMMAGGSKEAYDTIEPLLTNMAASVEGETSNEQRATSNGKCVAFLGPGGAGHFVKMVHNGIEYGVMELIAEIYAVLKLIGNFSNEQLAETFEAWNDGDDLQSFLIEITGSIFRHKDSETGQDLIDVIAGRAGQKGTGKWTTQAALDLGVPIPTITAAVDARIMSGMEQRNDVGPFLPESLDFSEAIPAPMKLRSVARKALELSTILTYIQGFELIRIAGSEWNWHVNLSEVARIWRGGCIIRSDMLERFQKLMSEDQKVRQAAFEAILERFKDETQTDWRFTVDIATSRGIPIPALSASLAYYDSMRAKWLPTNLIQAQRDYFGAHTYERVDRGGAFHTEWE